MSIRKKTLVIVGITFLILMLFLIAISQIVVMGSFKELENQNTRLNVIRTLNELSHIFTNINTTLGDWAPWDATYKFIQSGDKSYINENLQDATVNNLKLNFLIFINNEEKVVYVKCIDLKEGKEVALFDGLLDQITATKKLIKHSNTKSSKSGIIMFSETPVFVASQPILKSDFSGPAAGSLIMGRFLDKSEIKRLSKMTFVSVDVRPYMDSQLPPDYQEAKSAITDDVPIYVKPMNAEFIAGYSLQKDLMNKPAFILKIQMPRKIYQHGQRTFYYYISSLMIVGFVFIVLILYFLEKYVLFPLSRLSGEVAEIGNKGNFVDRLPITSTDELGSLANTINLMLEQLSDARKKIQEQSYRSGMAEMAAGVLHNVRNAINPLLGHIELLLVKFRKTPIDKIEIATQELENNSCAKERREDLIRFLLFMNSALAALINDADQNLNDAVERIHHIENILYDHQQWASPERPLEPVDLEEFVRDSIKFLKNDLKENLSIHIDSGISKIGAVMIHRVALEQVFSNILINAAESIQRKGIKEGDVYIDARIDKIEDKEMVHIRIRDNGEGIGAEMKGHIFERGFSTKESASGIGLHWCANAISSMKGSIYAESEGIGKGALFHLLLPLASEKF